jgi:EmrB/QacA subfamily drug resistance transporter
MTVMAEGDQAPPGQIRYASAAGRWVLGVSVLGSSIAFLEATVVNVALPEIGSDLDADVAGLQWIINGYLLTLAALILLGGSLGDRYGRRKIFNLGVIWFTAASVLCALAPNSEILIAARVIQGIGGALLTPGSLAIIEATFYPEDRGRAIGAWSALGGISTAIGPLLGGWLIEAVSWRAIFFMNIPLGVFVVWAAARHIPETRDPMIKGKLDFPGSVLASIALAGLTFTLIQAPVDGVGSPMVLTALLLGLASAVAFVIVEQRSPEPMLPLSIFDSKQFTSANFVTFVVYAALGGVFFLLVVFLQVALGYSPVAAGAASLPVTALLLVLSPRAGALAQRIGPRVPLTLGPIVVAAGMLLMTRIDPGDSYLEAVLPAVVVFGLGLSLVVAPITATVLASADERHAGVASGINNAVARTAQLVAVAGLPLIAGLSGADYESPVAITDGFHVAMVACAIFSVAGGVLAWLTISSDVLHTAPATDGDVPDRAATDYACGVAGTPLRPAREARCEPATDGQPVQQVPAAAVEDRSAS